jgi:CHAT domain-containing protein
MILVMVLSLAAVPASTYLTGKNLIKPTQGQVTLTPESWAEAPTTYVQVEDEASFIRSRIQQAQELQAQGLYRKSCGILLQALTDKNLVLALGNEKLGCEDLNRDEETFQKVKTALQLQFSSLPANDLSRLKLTALRGFGDVLRVVVDLDRSIEVLQLSLGAAKQLSSQAEAEVLLSLGNIARALGNRTREREGSIKRDPEDSIREAQPTLPPASLGCISEPQKDEVPQENEAINFYQQAIVCYQQAVSKATSSTTQLQAELNHLSLFIEIEKWLQNNGKDMLAKAWWSQVQPHIPNLTKIQQQIDSLPSNQTTVYTQINWARSLIYLYLKQNLSSSSLSFPMIEQLLTKVKAQAQTLGDKQIESYAIGNLGWLYEQIQKPDIPDLSQIALDLTQQALKQAESLKANDLIYQWAWQSGRLFKAQGNIKEAIYAYAEAFNSLQFLRNDLLGINPDIQFDFRDSVESVYRELVGLLVQYQPTQGQAELTLEQKDSNESIVQIVQRQPRDSETPSSTLFQQNLKLSLGIIEALQLAELENFLQCNLLNASIVPVNKVAEDSSAAIFYPIILEDRLEVILKLPQQELQHFSTYVKRSDLEYRFKELRRTLMDRTRERDFEPLSRQAYDLLIRPAEKYLNTNTVKTLVFVLDGSLRNIPMSALYDGNYYLIEKYPIAITPGLQLLGPKPSGLVPSKALIGGLTIPDNLTIKIRGKRFTFRPLQNVQAEVDDIKSSFRDYKEMVGLEFTNDNFRKNLNSASYPVVHLATHGNFSSSPQETFFLTASEQPINVNELQDVLQTREQTRPDAIELLVFSACKTAVGDRRATLGLAGVAIRAGANSTLASLWSVSDESTASLMKNFYKEWTQTQKQMTKAEALRRAQLALLYSAQGEKDLPYFWAPFVLVGNWL